MGDVDTAQGDDPAPAGSREIRPRHAWRSRQPAWRPATLHLYQNGAYTLYTIYASSEPESIGTGRTSGCVGLLTQDMIHLYARTPVKTKVVVLPA